MADTSETLAPDEQAVRQQAQVNKTRSWILVAALIYLLIAAVSIIGSGFQLATADRAEELFQFATNPFVGLMVGIVATALIQSSSTVSSIIVGLVAGGLPVAVAVPMIMGSNIGTTVTNTLVSLGHVRDPEEFKRAFSSATVHDFFNLLAVAIFLPLEIMFNFVERAALALASPLNNSGDLSMDGVNFMSTLTAPVTGGVEYATSGFNELLQGLVMIVIGIALIMLSIRYVGTLLKVLMVGKAKQVMHTAIGKGPFSGIASGAVVTVLVQSSSTTTSLMVPLAGSGTFKLREIYPFTLGTNVGTTVTALLAATAASGPLAIHALEIALVHLLFNVFALAVIFSIPLLRNIPLFGAEWLAALAAKQKVIAAAWVLGVFIALPGVLILSTSVF